MCNKREGVGESRKASACDVDQRHVKREGEEYKVGRVSEESMNCSCPLGLPHPVIELCTIFSH